VEFEWDETKRQSNLAKHGIDFRLTRRLVDGVQTVTTRGSFQDEERFLTTGAIDGRFVTVVWTRRDDTVRIISARRARDAERRAHRSLYGGGA
jgi:uncharacterized DUF497 family protein